MKENENKKKENRRNSEPKAVRVESLADIVNGNSDQPRSIVQQADALAENRFEVFIHNLEYLLAKNNISQAVLCERELDGNLSSPQLTSYKHRGKDIPFHAMALVAAYFHTTVETMCSTLMDEMELTPGGTLAALGRPASECNKYLGTYDLAYFDTGKQVGKNTRTTAQSLGYGLMSVYLGNAVNGAPTLKVAAFVNCTKEERDAIETAVKKAQATNRVPDIRDCYRNCAKSFHSLKTPNENRYKCLYEGSLELTERVAEFTLHQVQGTDVVHIIAHNRAAISSSGAHYRGGLATMMSVSRGAEHMPCAQSVIISRRGFATVSGEELANYLYLCPPQIDVKESTNAILEYMKLLFAGGENNPVAVFSEEDRRYCLESYAEKKLSEAVRRNILSYYKVSIEMDYDVYQKFCR